MLSARFSVQQVLGGVVVLALTAAVAPPLQAQISVKATPYSFRANLVEEIPSYTLYREHAQKPAPQLRRVDQEDFFLIPPAQPGAGHRWRRTGP